MFFHACCSRRQHTKPQQASLSPSPSNQAVLNKIQRLLLLHRQSPSSSSSLGSTSSSSSPRNNNKSRPVLKLGPFLVSDLGVLMSGYYSNASIAAHTERHRITHVINMAHDDDHDNDERQALHQAVGVRYLGLQADDSLDFPLTAQCLPVALDFAHEFFANKQDGDHLLVHCMAGINRSGAVAVALVCVHEHKSLLDAIAQVSQRRDGGPILTNVSFQNQLVDWARDRGCL